MDIKEKNPLVLAYLGDAIYEYYIRSFLVRKNIPNIKELQQTSLNYVSATNQAKFLKLLQEENFFTYEEEDIIRRARNTKGHRAPKNCNLMTYKQATALEAVIGYLSLLGKEKRIEKLMNKILESTLC